MLSQSHFRLTQMIRPIFMSRIKKLQKYTDFADEIQQEELKYLLSSASATEIGLRYGFKEIPSYMEFKNRVPLHRYEDLKPLILRMIEGEKDILWRGMTKNFAQSSGTSDGKSKYIPITKDSFKRCHYQGGFDVVANYLNLNPQSNIFSGKGFILGGSFANELHNISDVKVGDLSANLIDNINPLANLVRIPNKRVALMEDWEKKLPALVEASRKENITNISGVPSWFLTVIREIMKKENVSSIHEVWPNLEVFFHGGISFAPYKSQYEGICDSDKMHYLETYNASEGFFGVQSSWDSTAMLLLLDLGIFYEFIPIDDIESELPITIPIWEVEKGKSYELVISANNGLWRYRIGDTVKIESVSPVKIKICGRTKNFINAFGEELMVHNADEALTCTCKELNACVQNYTAAPVYTTEMSRGCHQWLIEFTKKPDNIEEFAQRLDRNLQKENSDYEAKRCKDIFLDNLVVIEARNGLFDDWLKSTGKLGGQRKVPRLSNDREIMEKMLEFNHN